MAYWQDDGAKRSFEMFNLINEQSVGMRNVTTSCVLGCWMSKSESIYLDVKYLNKALYQDANYTVLHSKLH